MANASNTTYSEEVVSTIFARIAQGESVVSICSDPGMPAQSAFYKWMDSKPELVERYTCARKSQANTIFDKMLNVAENTEIGITKKIKPEGEEITEGDMLGHRKLKIDTYKWILSKLEPKKYGEKIDIDMTADVTTHQYEITTKDDPDDIDFVDS